MDSYTIDTLAPALYHLKLQGRDQWEVRMQITGAEAKTYTRKDVHLIKMEIPLESYKKQFEDLQSSVRINGWSKHAGQC